MLGVKEYCLKHRGFFRAGVYESCLKHRCHIHVQGIGILPKTQKPLWCREYRTLALNIEATFVLGV